MRFLKLFHPALCAVALSGALGACAPHPPPPVLGGATPGITVTGTGEVQARPDIARIRLGIEVRHAALEEATREANQRMGAIVAALKGSGIADADLRTNAFSVRFEREHPGYPEPPTPTPRPEAAPIEKAAPPKGAPAGYFVVQNTVEATIRKVDDLGRVLGAALGAGANDVGGIEFDVDKPESLQAEARQKAIADARAKAQALATHAGVALGAPVSITDVGGGGRPVPMMAMAKFEGAQVPVESGQMTFSEQVQVVYAIGK
jgi:uncharacterized protein YggE